MTSTGTTTALSSPAPSRQPDAAALDAGTYEVLRSRLAAQAAVLKRRSEAVNAERLATFGSTELRLIGTERIRTENNCVPRDVVFASDAGGHADGVMLFGFNVFIGLKPETTVDDVFSLHTFVRDGNTFRFDDSGGAELPGLLRDEGFRRDFAELYRYYRDARLRQLRRVGDKLLAVFQTSGRTEDDRVLRWQVDPGGAVSYIDNRGERDHVYPAAHDFEWVATTRDDHVLGRHPHISIEDELFVETINGDLTLKIENNTETGKGIYSEPVDEPLQNLADATVLYARLGPLLLLRIQPYNETRWRHIVFNTRTKEVTRLDGIERACQRLPDDQGIIFPGGYYLVTGAAKTFHADASGMEFEQVIRSGNGEDVLYVFRDRAEGRTLMLPYNVIRKEVATPIPCHGYSLFDDGTLVVFRAASEEPTRVHPMQVWQTPYLSDTYAARQPSGTGPLHRVGNADLVRGISDCLSVARMVEEMAPSAAVFEGIIAACQRIFDGYHWLGDAELGDLRTPLADLRSTAEAVLDEFAGVQSLTEQAASAVDEATTQLSVLVRHSRSEAPRTAQGWVTQLAQLRAAQGQLITLRGRRYVDLDRVDQLVTELETELSATARRAVEFLRTHDAFAAYHDELDELISASAAIRTVAEASPVGERLTRQADGLQVVMEVIGSLDIADATVRTQILERVGEVLGGVNRARATLDGRRRELLATEGRAEFAAEIALLGQAVTGAIAASDTPAACDEQLARLLLQVENLESRFAEFDDFVVQLAERRTDFYEAFSARKQALQDERIRRADRLVDSADRILASVTRRIAGLASVDEVNSYFAADPMVAKLRGLAGELREIGDQVRAEELEGRVKAARQEAGRALRDRIDLYGDAGDTIRLGRHRFAVSTQPVDLTVVPHTTGGALEMAFTITGTDYREPVRDGAFQSTRHLWDQHLVSESAGVYRAEFLAASMLEAGPLDALHEAAVVENGLLTAVRAAAAQRYDEGYQRGVHDHDAALILDALLRLHAGAGLLRYPPGARAAAQLFWVFGADAAARAAWTTRAGSLARARITFGMSDAVGAMGNELAAGIGDFLRGVGLGQLAVDSALAGEYLFEELACTPVGFVTGAGARTLLDRFRRALAGPGSTDFDADLRGLDGDLAARHQLVTAWLTAFAAKAADRIPADVAADVPEAIAIELCGTDLPRHDSSAALSVTVTGMLGTHPTITGRTLPVRLDELLTRVRRFRGEQVPAFREYVRQRSELVRERRRELRLNELTPSVMSAFVRNKLLDEVYLPLIGDNLAKQLGAAGADKRTDQMGLLLLISPPGYGKTTLMEYVANRLGMVFVKVNGPALGHGVTSLDPAEAPNATARQEVEKISFALEMGNNVLLYLDDIQHTSPELLQKFISLCDAQRRMEGVWGGGTRTYDLRGKRFAVCMAGNPYTEHGHRFRIPDMLANRADVWNLGDVLSGKDELFALSYVENALTSNPVLAPLSSADRHDVELLVRMADDDPGARPDQLAHPLSAVELQQVLAVLRKLRRVQRIVLTVNEAYIASAAQADSSRTEPPFRLQGSYRNMNKLAARIVPVMNDAELDALVDDHYRGEAQTLTSDAEANLLKLAELRGRLTPEQAQRWDEVKAGFLRAAALGGSGDDPVGRAVGAVGLLADRVAAVQDAISDAAARLSEPRA
ncbi:DNA repair ATPase [Pseudonocardia sp. TRM90224]|uniref:DNA repair ATPase n=1 Tax=Pseudonocardia sp. TRM90224 TaxID=2812678 RepID=UPI001E2B7DAD|nr:DNA repair ATPase [Pseudonocardia sp. TRM90224]